MTGLDQKRRAAVTAVLLAAGLLGWMIQPAAAENACPPPGPVETYKGRTLIGSAYPKANNARFFKWMKWAIDKVETLPARLRRPSEAIKVICYDPPSKLRKTKSAVTNTVGVYALGADEAFPAPVVIYQDLKWAAPIFLAYSLAANGLMADYHRRRLKLTRMLRDHQSGKAPMPAKALAAARREAGELLAYLAKSDQAVVDRYKCEPMRFEFELTKIWETDVRVRDARARRISKHGCWK